jgi:hypothetical protein
MIPKNIAANGMILEALIGRLYQEPVIIPDKFVKQSDLPRMNIIGFTKEPALQVWAGPPGTQNEIITVEDSKRRRYLVKGILNSDQSEILPPVETQF